MKQKPIQKIPLIDHKKIFRIFGVPIIFSPIVDIGPKIVKYGMLVSLKRQTRQKQQILCNLSQFFLLKIIFKACYRIPGGPVGGSWELANFQFKYLFVI